MEKTVDVFAYGEITVRHEQPEDGGCVKIFTAEEKDDGRNVRTEFALDRRELKQLRRALKRASRSLEAQADR